MEIELNSNYLDCLRDTPKFRKTINSSFTQIVDFQDSITDISDSFTQTIKSGFSFSCNYQIFCSKMEKLNKHFDDDEFFQNDFTRIIQIFTEFKEYFKLLMENFHAIQKDFRSFSEYFKEIESSKKLFSKASDNLDNSQQKCASIQKSKLTENCEADTQCNIAKKEFIHSSLTFMTHIEKFEIYKHSLFLRACIGITTNKSKFYSQGNEFMLKVEPWIEHINDSKKKYDKMYDEKRIKSNDVIHNFCNGKIQIPAFNDTKTSFEGYLFKWPRKSWQKYQRRWFKVENNQLFSCKRADDSFSIVEEDLRMCTAKEYFDTDRRFCFELIGLNHSLVLQADDEISQKRWIECFQNGMSYQMDTLKKQRRNSQTEIRKKSSIGINNSMPSRHDTIYNKSEDRKSKLLRNVLAIKGNSSCCDCDEPKAKWASSSLGITLCTECSGSHRSLGVHISKVRSLTLDNWEPEMLCVMFMLGNEVVNQIFESNKEAIAKAADSGIPKPDSNTDMNTRKLWTKAKWEKKQFVQSNVSQLLADLLSFMRTNMVMFSLPDMYQFTSVSDLLQHGLEMRCLPLVMLALALNASPNGDGVQDLIPIHLAASIDFWPGCEFLILNGAKIDITDEHNQTALHKACQNQNVLVVWLLLKRGARQNIRDSDDNEVLQIAMNTTNANTVTLLRLQMLNENTKEANLGSKGDETVNDVFRDFTERAFDQIDEWFTSDPPRSKRMNSSKSLVNNAYL